METSRWCSSSMDVMYAALNILSFILIPNDTPEKAWLRIAVVFQDNKHSQAFHLENQLTSTKLVDFPNTTTYCNRLKLIADQLGNVDVPVNNPLPPFDTTKSKLVLEETTIIQCDSHDTDNTAFISQNTSTNKPPKSRHSPSPPHYRHNYLTASTMVDTTHKNHGCSNNNGQHHKFRNN